MKRPLTGLVSVFMLGILAGAFGEVPVTWLLAAAVVVTFGAVVWPRYPWLLWVLVGLAGMVAYRVETGAVGPRHITRLLGYRDQNIGLRGVVVSPPERGFELRLTGLNTDTGWQAAEGTVLVFVADAQAVKPRYGDAIECSALLRVPPPAMNPGTFDWRQWLRRQGIQFTATIRQIDSCRVLAADQGHPVMAWSLRLREVFEQRLRIGLETEPAVAGVLAGMVAGQRAEIPADASDEFQRTGVFHVFAISGLHVGVVTLVVVTMVRLVRVPRRWCGLVAIPVLVLYVLATGARPGAIRALVMASVWLAGWMLVRPVDALSALAAAALLILVWQPTQLFEGGFILSFSVVLALIVLMPRLQKQLTPWTEPDPLVPAVLVSPWAKSARVPARWVVGLVSCSLASWIGLLPLMAAYFNLFTPVSLLANVIVIPLVSLIIPVGMISAAVPWFSETLNNANFGLLHLMLAAVDRLGRVPGGHWFVQTPPVWLVLLYYAGVAVCLWRGARLRWLALPVCLVIGVAAWPRSSVEITTLDLHDGVATFVNVPGEHDDFLLNGGGDWTGKRVVLPFLRSQGVDRLAAVVVTRGDKAHAAGLRAIVDDIPVGRAVHAGTGSRSRFFWDWLTAMRERRLPIEAWTAGQVHRFGGLEVEVLHPTGSDTSTRSDDKSMVLMLRHGATRVLLMSDIGITVENRLLASGADLRAEILIKGRHGVEPSGSDAFLDAVRPSAVIVSVGTRPSTRYLEPELRERLRARGITLYRTDESGAVTVRLTGTGYRMEPMLKDRTAPGRWQD